MYRKAQYNGLFDVGRVSQNGFPIYILSDKEACQKYKILSKLEQNIVDMRPMKVVMNKQLNIQFKGNKDLMKQCAKTQIIILGNRKLANDLLKKNYFSTIFLNQNFLLAQLNYVIN